MKNRQRLYVCICACARRKREDEAGAGVVAKLSWAGGVGQGRVVWVGGWVHLLAVAQLAAAGRREMFLRGEACVCGRERGGAVGLQLGLKEGAGSG